MKVNLYYVVKPFKASYDTIGKHADAILVSGPMPTLQQAQNLVVQMENPQEYSIVVDELKVKLA